MKDSWYIWRAGLVGAIFAAVANLAVYATGRAADVEFTLGAGDSATQVGVTPLLLMSIVSVLLGTALAVVLARAGSHRLRWAQATGAAVAVLTVGGPLSAAGVTATGILLVSMHLITGAIYVLALQTAKGHNLAGAGTDSATVAAVGR